MFRLVALTLAGFFAVLLIYGNPESAGADTRAGPVAVADARLFPPGVIEAAFRAEPHTERTELIDHAELTRRAIAAATPPGTGEGAPKLRPSPEHADKTTPAIRVAEGPTLYVTGTAVNLRAAPDGDVLGSLRRGTAVTSLGPTSGAWIEIEADGTRGFMSARFLSPRQPG